MKDRRPVIDIDWVALTIIVFIIMAGLSYVIEAGNKC